MFSKKIGRYHSRKPNTNTMVDAYISLSGFLPVKESDRIRVFHSEGY
jgi:hypothetical protein